MHPGCPDPACGSPATMHQICAPAGPPCGALFLRPCGLVLTAASSRTQFNLRRLLVVRRPCPWFRAAASAATKPTHCFEQSSSPAGFGNRPKLCRGNDEAAAGGRADCFRPKPGTTAFRRSNTSDGVKLNRMPAFSPRDQRSQPSNVPNCWHRSFTCVGRAGTFATSTFAPSSEMSSTVHGYSFSA